MGTTRRIAVARNGDSPISPPDAATLSRVTRVLRMIDQDASASLDLATLAEMARLSSYHFLRILKGVTVTTPHQYVLRARLRRAAFKLKMSNDRMVDIALDCGKLGRSPPHLSPNVVLGQSHRSS